MGLEITGKLIQVLPEQTGTGKNGNWVKQGFIIETEGGQFPRKAYFILWGEKTRQLKSLKPGTQLKVSFDVDSREFNGKWYTDLRAWRIESSEPAASDSGESTTVDFMPDPVQPDAESKDDLPF